MAAWEVCTAAWVRILWDSARSPVRAAWRFQFMKWKSLIAGATAVPTKSNPDCTTEDTGPSPVPTGTVGAFEGAGYYHCGLFRPEYNCRMRELAIPWRAVCQQ